MDKTITITADGIDIPAYLSLPPNGSGPGLLLMHAWWGLNSFFTELADRLAAEGYVVLAPDLYGGKTASTIDEAKELIGTLERDDGYRQAIKHEEAALDYLLNHHAVQGDKVGAIGFSMGVAYAAWLATLRPELKVVVMFYGGSDLGEFLGEDFGQQTNAAFLGHFAEGDEWEPDEGVHALEAQLKEAGKDATFHFYPAVSHWFFEDDRKDAYNREAAQLAWERTVKFLHDNLV